ncbi:MAG: TlpA family protein disulfide reductase [Chloroflexi bacterium]|nr:TlpA family protein disulfide reductase [Chloroflexota bacterium]
MPGRERRSRRKERGRGGASGAGSASPKGESIAQRRAKSRQKQSRLLVIAGAVALVAVVAVVVGQVVAGGGTASDFEFSVYQGEEELGGSEIQFMDLLDRGKPVVLNFWAGACPPCRAEMPALQRVYDAHRGEIIFVGLDVGVFTGLGTRQEALALLEELNISYPAGAPPDRTPVVSYSVVSMPTTVFFGADGEVFRIFHGAISEERMNGIVDAMLGAS